MAKMETVSRLTEEGEKDMAAFYKLFPQKRLEDYVDKLCGEALGVAGEESWANNRITRSKTKRNQHFLGSYAARLAEVVWPLVRDGGYRQMDMLQQFPFEGRSLSIHEVGREMQTFVLRFLRFLAKHRMTSFYPLTLQDLVPYLRRDLSWDPNHSLFSMSLAVTTVHEIIEEGGGYQKGEDCRCSRFFQACDILNM